MTVGDTQKSIFGFSPDNWIVDRIYDHLSAVVGGEWGEDPDLEREGVEIPVIRVADIRGIDVTSEDLTIRQVKETKLADRLINKNTFLLEKSGGGEQKPVGRAVRVRAINFPAICSNFMNKIDCNETTDPSFVVYALHALYNRGVNGACIQQTTGIQNLRIRDYLSTKIAYPKRDEQERIAAYLDKSCPAIDAAVKAKRSQIETLYDVRKAIISRAVTQGLKENVVFKSTGNVWIEKIPHGWGLTALKRVSEIQTGLTLGKTYEGELVELPYLRVANVQDGHLDLSDVTLIEVPPDVALRVQLRVGDVLMTEGGDLDKLGRGYLWNGEINTCLHQNHIFAVRCFQHKVLPLFLAHLTASKHGRDYFEATGKKTTNLASTSAKKVGLFPIPLPPISEQKEICDYIDQKNSEIRELIDKIEKQIDALLGYRKSLIHECVTGQRRVTEADLKQV